jgi:hypothetical protein
MDYINDYYNNDSIWAKVSHDDVIAAAMQIIKPLEVMFEVKYTHKISTFMRGKIAREVNRLIISPFFSADLVCARLLAEIRDYCTDFGVSYTVMHLEIPSMNLFFEKLGGFFHLEKKDW